MAVADMHRLRIGVDAVRKREARGQDQRVAPRVEALHGVRVEREEERKRRTTRAEPAKPRGVDLAPAEAALGRALGVGDGVDRAIRPHRRDCCEGALGATQEVLARELGGDSLSPEQRLALQPRLAALLAAVAAGFCDQAREIISTQQAAAREASPVEQAAPRATSPSTTRASGGNARTSRPMRRRSGSWDPAK